MSVESQVSPSGTIRSAPEGKIDYSLLRDGPMMSRWAIHLSKGGAQSLSEPRIYPARNWMLSSSMEDLDRYKTGAARHFEQWFAEMLNEDHAASLFFNVNGAEYVKRRLKGRDIFLPEEMT